MFGRSSTYQKSRKKPKPKPSADCNHLIGFGFGFLIGFLIGFFLYILGVRKPSADWPKKWPTTMIGLTDTEKIQFYSYL
jgi:hypothetical protein